MAQNVQVKALIWKNDRNEFKWKDFKQEHSMVEFMFPLFFPLFSPILVIILVVNTRLKAC